MRLRAIWDIYEARVPVEMARPFVVVTVAELTLLFILAGLLAVSDWMTFGACMLVGTVALFLLALFLMVAADGWSRLEFWGFGVWIVVSTVIGVGLFARIDASVSAAMLVGLIALVVVFGLLCYWGGGIVRALVAFVGLTLGATIFAWILVSTTGLGVSVLSTNVQFFLPKGTATLAEVRQDRATRLKASPESSIAISLSGGGYRAAVTHAGVLWTFDQARLPVTVLSTVSGGAIVGAVYALGWSPLDFKKNLSHGSPGLLVEDVFSFFPVFAQIVYPRWGSGDTLSFHLARRYFGLHKFAALGPPELVVNATDFRNGTHAAFWSANARSERVAKVVAASAAYPGAFTPV